LDVAEPKVECQHNMTFLMIFSISTF